MKKILLIAISNYTIDPGSDLELSGKNHKPIGILSIATYLKSRDYRVVCIDQLTEDPVPYIRKNNNNLLFVGLSVMSACYSSALSILYLIKKLNPDLPCIIGGAHPSGNPKQVIDDGFDIAVIGEGEKICEDLANIFLKIKMNNKKALFEQLSKIQSITYKNESKIITMNSRIEFIENLDNLPIIDRALLKSTKYSRSQVTVFTSRGCPGKCIYCQSGPNFFGHKIRQRSPENVVAEIKELIHSGVRLITFLDDCLLWNEHWVHKFCDLIKEEQIKFIWVCETRAQYLTESILKKIIEAGCRGVNIGFESGSDKTLKFFRKRSNLKIYKNCINLLHHYGLSFHSYIIVGSPHETKEDLQLTVDFIKEAKPTQICVSHLTPIYGSELFDYLRKKNLIADVDQQIFYQNRYPIKYENLSCEDIDHYEIEIYKAMYIPGKIPIQLKGDAFIFDDPIPFHVIASKNYKGIIRVKNISNFHWIAYPDQIKIPMSELENKAHRDNFYQQIEGHRVLLKIDWFDEKNNMVHSDINGNLIGNVFIKGYGIFIIDYTIPAGYNKIFFEYNLYLPDNNILMSDIGYKPFKRGVIVHRGNKRTISPHPWLISETSG